MKVILLQELKGKGSEGDVVDVARGFAVNYLFPRKMAVQATTGNLKQLEARVGNIHKRDEARRADAQGIAARLEGSTVVIGARAGEGGRLYGSITSQMIEDAILGQLDVEVDRRKMDVHGHIKVLGDHSVNVRLHKDVAVEMTVRVEAESAEGEAPTPAVAKTAASAVPAEAAEGEIAAESAETSEAAEAAEETVVEEVASVDNDEQEAE